MNEDNRKRVYDVLKEQTGYLDSYEDFNKAFDASEDNRRRVYDVLKNHTGYLDSYEDFTKGMSAPATSVAQQVIDEYDRANQSSINTGAVLNDNSAGSPKIPGYDAVGRLYELMERNKPSLNELVKKNSQDKLNDRDTFQTPIYENALRVANRMRKEQAMRSEDYGYRPSIAEPIEREKNTFEQEEERRIDELYHPKKVENESDVLENYRNRFVLSIRGGKLDGELAEKRGEVEAKYLQIFTQSPEYQDLLRLGASAEEINEKFYQQYGDAINGELRPYENAIFQEMANRYRGRIQEEFTQLQKQRSTDQLKALAGEVDELSKQAHKNLQRRAPSSGNAMNALMGSRNYTQSSEEERRQVGMLNAAKRLIEQSQEIVAEAGKQGGTNFVAGLGRGLRDNMDWENFTFGLADMADALYLNNALEKYEAGNTLSEAEQKLLEASAVNMAIQGFYSSDLGRGYNAGRVTAESLPFMLEFIANPISGSSNAIAKSLLKFGLRRFGRFGSFAARVAGSTGAALGMTGTTGVPRVASGTMDRLNQNYDYYLDENGDLQVQKTGNVGTLKAMGKSIASTALENQSEMVLNAFRVFRPYLRQLEKSLPGGVNSFMQMVKKSRPGQLYRELKNNPTLRELVQRTQFQGLPQEYLEEVYDNFANIPLGDMTLDEAIDLDNNLDIILGLTPTFLAFGMIGAGSMAAERYQNRKRMERIFGKMTDEQRKKFEELQRMSKVNGNEDIKNFIKITMADPELTQEQKRDEIDYAFAIAKQNAIDEIQEAGTQDRIDAETEDIVGHSDPSTNTYTEAKRIYMNDVGEWVKEPGHIVGWQDPEKERFPYWIPEGAEFTPENTRLLRPGEWDATTVKSMPTQEVIDETAQAIREDAAVQAQRESTYSPDIVPYNQLEPGRSSFYDKDGNLYSVGNIDTDTKNFMMLVTSPEGKQIASRPFSEEEYLSIRQAQIDSQEAAGQQIIQQLNNSPINEANDTISPTEAESNTSEQSPQSVPNEGTEEADRIPTDEKGNLLYHRAPVETTVASINSEGLEPDEVDAFIQANKDASAKLLKNVEGKAPKMGTNIAQFKKAKQEWQARVAEAQAQVDYWNQVADAIQSQRTQVGDATAEDILSMGEPMDGHELAAQMLATGKLPLLQADFKRETGYKGDEARSLFGLFASEANGGMTIERAGEQLMLADQEAGTNFFDQSDPNAGRNAILDVLSEVRTRGDLTNYIRRNREAMAERERQAEYDAYADWCEREMHMTPEEYEAYQEYVVANNPYEGVAVEELDRIFAEAEEEIQTYLNQKDNGQQGTSENGSSPDSGPSERDEPAGTAGSREAGVSVLPEAQPVLPGQVQGRTEGAASQPGTADDGVRAEEGTVSEGASGGAGIENQINDENNEINVVSSQSNQNDTENEQGEVAGISGESSSLDGENEAATILRTTGHSSTTQDGQGSQSKESLLGELAERASGSNQWIDDITSITSSPIGKGGENETYLSRDGRFAIKVNDFSYLPDNSTNFDSFMNRVDAHNELFPNDAITILGFTRNSEGKIAVVLSQPYISNAREATQEEIDNFLEGMDFYTDMSGNWTDGTFDIADTKPNNVLVDADGNLHFIDVLPYDSRKPGKMLVIPPTRNAFVAPEREEGENLLDYAERVVKTKEIDDARKEVSANPTDAQKEAGNYRKGHITLDGYDITIENPKGSTRSGVDANGQSWSVTMNNDYGYIRGTEGVDGDHIDVFLSDDPTTGKVYVIDQVNEDGSFDEHKVMYGFKSALAAKRAYLSNYSPGWKGLGTISEISKEEFKKWIESSHRKTKPFAEYKSVKVDGAQNDTIKTHQPNALPGRLMKAYESGDTALIASVEQEMREFVNSANDMRSVYSTYLRSKDLERAMEKGSPSNKTQHFIAETCKDVLKKAGLPTKAMQSERARTEIAGSMTDPHVLDIMSADTSFNVLRAIIHNPNTSESTLKHFTKVFSNNGLDYEAQQELDKRQSQNGDELRFREVDVEDRKELVAVHNLSADKLKQAFDLGGFPMPSIAITKADVGHTEFGEISLVFDKESINPTDRRNKVYGEDAWTPTFPAVGYKLNDAKTSGIYRRANKAGNLPLFNPVIFHPDNYENYINSVGSESLVEHFKDDYGAKQLYLSETGNAVGKYEQHEVDKYQPDQISLYEKILKEIGIERLKNEKSDALENDVKQLIEEHYNIDFDTMKPFRAKVRISNAIHHAIDYVENGNKKTETDIEATKKKIDERIDSKKFGTWLEDLFTGVVEKRGIRNDKDPFTSSGSSRKWEQLYDDITLDSVVNAMQRQAARGGQGLFNGSIFGAAQEEYKSIDEIRKEARERIRTLNDEEYKAQRDAITNRLSNINIPGVGNGFSDTMNMVGNIQDAVARSHTAKGIYKYLKEFYPKVTMETANEIADIVKDIQRMSARYFEAKPYRAVGFDEVRLAVVPSDVDKKLVQELEQRGIPVRTYERGNEAQRRQIVEEATDEMNLRFREIQEVNERFNEKLSGLTEDNADKVTLDLGNPSPVLLAAGVEDKPMKLYGNKVIKKMKKHGFKLDELRNLPEAVAEPIAVFNNYQKEGNRSILTELETANGNFLVTIDLGKDADVDFNIVTSVFGKGDNNIITWINKGYATYIDKQKTLDYLHHSALKAVTSDNREEKVQEFLSHQSAPIAATAANSELSDATKIVKKFENPIIDSEITRNGNVNLSDDALSTANDPVAKLLGKSTRTAHQRQAFAERERRNMAKRVQELAEKLHLDNVEIVTEPMTITDRQGKTHHPKGFYNPRTGKITVVVPNNVNTFDVEQTLLHETVAHYGLRQLFGEHFDIFLDNVYNNADVEVRRKIVELAKKNGWNPRLATEEYLASLAEDTNFENINASWWSKIKELFLQMLHKIGFNDFNGVTLSDNELRYILWRSYENLAEPGRYRSILGEAADVVKQHELKVGNYAQVPAETDNAAEGANDLYRETPDGQTSDDGSRDAYNRSVAGNRFKAQEAYQDSMLALKRLQEVVEKYSGSKLKSYENAYMAENQMSSKSTRETEVYGEKFFKPMLQEVATLMKKGVSYQEIIDYMIAKHGLERNEVFAKRDAAQEADRRFEKLYKELEQLYKLGGITQAEYDKRKAKIDAEKEKYYRKRLAQHLEEDYSGLTALAEKYDEADKGFKANARDMVNDFETRFNTRSLWEKVNASTKETLRKSYESGMMSKDTYDKINKMFSNYIPLRGWDVNTAEDVFEYLNSETSPVNSVLKSAKGRRSMSDDPLATIGNMAESTILQGNRNLMKQNFLNMAINHPTDVLTVREAWYVKDPSTGEWVLSFPDIEENDDADTIARKVEEHEERMNMLKENGEATQVKEGLNIDYRISARQAKEHIVNVKRNGKDYLVFVNGSPRAAQAVNGMTNPSVETNKLLEGISRFNRQLAANFTNRNPAFVLSNLSRDLIFAVSAVNIKEGGAYARRFAANIPRAMRVIARNLRGKGDANHADDALFEEFLDNGGETGYTSLHSVDEYKRMVSRELNKITGKRDYFRAVRASAQFFSMMNRWAEDVSRFTTYMTSREQGKTISESVNDAKEVTVNFNKKGAGVKTSGVFGWTSGLFRNLYLFFNAAVQSLANFSRLSKKNPKAFYTTLGGFTAAGFLVPVLNGIAISMLGGDDDDYYGNLPEWVRRNNLCLYAGNGKFITIPLPIELRAFYGLGEMAYQATISEDTNGGDKIAYQAINQITELLPINPLGNNGDLVTTLMPDVISPFWQIYENKDFTGKPIYRQNAFNETMPEWTKAYNSTSDWLVKLSEWTNELAGGDKYKQADVLEPIMNWNPAKVEHLFESYFGGMAKTFNQTAKTLAGGVESVLQGEKSDDLQWYSTPVLNRFVNDASDDRSAFSKVNERYYRLYDLYEEVGKELRGYGREAARGDLDYLDKLNRLYQSDDYKKYLIFKGNKRIIDRIRDMEKRLPEESTKEKEDLQKRVAEMKRSLLEQIDGIK